MRIRERLQGRRYRRRYGLASRNRSLDAALKAQRADPQFWDTPGARAYLENLQRIADPNNLEEWRKL